MNNALLQLKVKQRVNKLDSEDFDNIPCWQIQEAFNKAQREWVRRQVNAINQKRVGREGDSQVIADLQNLLVTWKDGFVNRHLFYESCDFPSDYIVFARVSAFAKKDECCPPRRLTIYQAEESDVDILLKDPNKNPSWKWAETFSTFFGNKVRIYTEEKFEIINPEVIYYRKPITVQFNGCTDTETGLTSTSDVLCEFRDSVIELIIDDAAAIISGDLDMQQNMQRLNQAEQHNT